MIDTTANSFIIHKCPSCHKEGLYVRMPLNGTAYTFCRECGVRCAITPPNYLNPPGIGAYQMYNDDNNEQRKCAVCKGYGKLDGQSFGQKCTNCDGCGYL